MIKKLFLCIFLTTLTFNLSNADDSAKYITGAKNFIQNLSNNVLGIITDSKLDEEQKYTNLRSKFIDNVDVNWAAKFVLGANFRKLNDDQKAEFSELYKEFLVHYYVPKFKEFNEDKVAVENVSPLSEIRFKVTTKIKRQNQSSVKVDYLVQLNDTNNYKIFDIVAEDVSMITTHRTEFNSVISQKGYDGMVQYLKDRIAKKVELDKKK